MEKTKSNLSINDISRMSEAVSEWHRAQAQIDSACLAMVLIDQPGRSVDVYGSKDRMAFKEADDELYQDIRRAFDRFADRLVEKQSDIEVRWGE